MIENETRARRIPTRFLWCRLDGHGFAGFERGGGVAAAVEHVVESDGHVSDCDGNGFARDAPIAPNFARCEFAARDQAADRRRADAQQPRRLFHRQKIVLYRYG